MGKIYTRRVPGDESNVYHCKDCNIGIATADEIVSRSFHGRGGPAYLIAGVINTYRGPPEIRVLMTGLHTVCDVFCVRCHNLLGWTYLEAAQDSEKYKIGKFVLERTKITGAVD